VSINLLSSKYYGGTIIWIFLPAYNEEASLPKLLPKLDTIMREHNFTYRLVVVNDGSTDKTTEILAAYAQRLPLDVITHPLNRGLGETERDGFEFISARCHPNDIIVRVEGDGTHKPKYVIDLIRKLEEGYDVVNTSRFKPGGAQTGLDRFQSVMSWAANMFMGIFFTIPGIRDYSCGYRAYRGRIIQDAIRIYGNTLIQLRGMGFTSTLEIIVKLHLLGGRFAEVPFVLRYDQKESSSKMIRSITTLGYFIMALLYYWPFGGWKSQYWGLRRLYRKNPEQAVERFALHSIRRRRVSRISL
jgi:dolichol-phosphate mannosyltransferase